MSGELELGRIPKHCQHREKLYGFKDNDQFIQKNRYFSLPFTHRLILAGLYKAKANYESKHTDVPSWFGYTALLQLQSTHRYDDRAGDLSCLGQITVHPQILGRCVPFKALSPAGAAKTSQPWEELQGDQKFAGQGPADEGNRWSHSNLTGSKS